MDSFQTNKLRLEFNCIILIRYYIARSYFKLCLGIISVSFWVYTLWLFYGTGAKDVNYDIVLTFMSALMLYHTSTPQPHSTVINLLTNLWGKTLITETEEDLELHKSALEAILVEYPVTFPYLALSKANEVYEDYKQEKRYKLPLYAKILKYFIKRNITIEELTTMI